MELELGCMEVVYCTQLVKGVTYCIIDSFRRDSRKPIWH
jgi:hypothetical protein